MREGWVGEEWAVTLGKQSLKDKQIFLSYFFPTSPLTSGVSKRKLLKVDRSGNLVKSFLIRETQEHCLQLLHFSFI